MEYVLAVTVEVAGLTGSTGITGASTTAAAGFLLAKGDSVVTTLGAAAAVDPKFTNTDTGAGVAWEVTVGAGAAEVCETEEEEKSTVLLEAEV